MRKLRMSALINYSIERTKLILFKPFSLKKWLCLLFIAWLSGALGGGNPGTNYTDTANKQADVVQLPQAGQQADSPLPSSQVAQNALTYRPDSADNSELAGFIVGSVVVLILVSLFAGLVLLLLWLGARFKFVWFKAIVANDASIAAPFKQYGKEGNSLFLFYVMLLLVLVGFLFLIGVWVFAVGRVTGVFASESGWSLPELFSTFFIPGLVFLAGMLAVVIFGVYVDHFVVPIMALEQCGFKPAWRKFVVLFKENSSDFVLYIFVLMGLGIAAAMIVFLAALACLVILALMAGVIFGIPYLLIAVFLKAKVLYMIFAISLAIPFIIIAVLLLASINLPFAVFFRSFALYFLSSLDCGYMPLAFEPMPKDEVGRGPEGSG